MCVLGVSACWSVGNPQSPPVKGGTRKMILNQILLYFNAIKPGVETLSRWAVNLDVLLHDSLMTVK